MTTIPSKNIIIKIDNQAIHFNSTFSIPIEQTNLLMENMKFHYHSDIYWKVELIEYIEDDKCWHVKVSDYSVDNIQIFSKQKSTKPIEKVVFDKLDWRKLEPQLSSYHAIKLIDLLYNYEINIHTPSKSLSNKPSISFKKESYKIHEEIPASVINPLTEYKYVPPEPKIDYINIDFSIKFQDATFISGYVTFKKFIMNVGTQVDFKIKNDYILEEFDNIKLWFAKKLKTKRFKVSAIITIIDGQISEVTASSAQIDFISPNIIESVKYDRTIALTKPPKSSNPDKSLYSTEEIFKLIDPEIKEGNIFNQSEPDIIKSLTQTGDVRNRKQLEYLSNFKQTTKSKIHYTLNPLFGFLFLIESNEKYHFAWELLQSHATYVWSIEKHKNEVKALYTKIEAIINIILKSATKLSTKVVKTLCINNIHNV